MYLFIDVYSDFGVGINLHFGVIRFAQDFIYVLTAFL